MQRIAMIGFGNVGQGLADILIRKQAELKRRHGYEYKVTAVADAKLGSVHDPAGLNLRQLLAAAGKKAGLESYAGGVKGLDALQTIRQCEADVLVELSYTNLDTGMPAIRHCREALKRGMSVVTSNKGPAALAYTELARLAARNGVQFRVEGTVMSGTPVLNLATQDLAGNRFTAVRGILNGTTNYILTQMEEGMDFTAALAKAQELGYAEADPTGDVDGHDAAGKVCILANMLMGAKLIPAAVQRRGIRHITPADIAMAAKSRRRWKLIGSARRTEDGTVEAAVKPEMLPLDDPLAGVMGATNALSFETDLLGKVTVIGPGAGRVETGFSILTDLLAIERSRR